MTPRPPLARATLLLLSLALLAARHGHLFAAVSTWLREIHRLGIQRVTGRTHRADDVAFATGVDRFAQAADVYVYGAQFDVAVTAPDAVKQALA